MQIQKEEKKDILLQVGMISLTFLAVGRVAEVSGAKVTGRRWQRSAQRQEVTLAGGSKDASGSAQGARAQARLISTRPHGSDIHNAGVVGWAPTGTPTHLVADFANVANVFFCALQQRSPRWPVFLCHQRVLPTAR